MDLYDYLLWLVFWIMGAVYGWYARERHAKRSIDRFFSHVEEAIEETVDNSVIHIDIEKHNETLFVYNKNTKEFMGQGKSRKDLENNLAKRFPDKRFAADNESLRILNESL
jgi:predicted DNA-binding protein YlxM (UPF0122 family)